MSLFTLPDPVSMYESAKMGSLERAAADSLVSAAYSSTITFLWSMGKRSLFGLGPALQAMATAQYLTLSRMGSKNFLTLTVPAEMLAADNLSKYETEWKTK